VPADRCSATIQMIQTLAGPRNSTPTTPAPSCLDATPTGEADPGAEARSSSTVEATIPTSLRRWSGGPGPSRRSIRAGSSGPRARTAGAIVRYRRDGPVRLPAPPDRDLRRPPVVNRLSTLVVRCRPCGPPSTGRPRSFASPPRRDPRCGRSRCTGQPRAMSARPRRIVRPRPLRAHPAGAGTGVVGSLPPQHPPATKTPRGWRLASARFCANNRVCKKESPCEPCQLSPSCS